MNRLLLLIAMTSTIGAFAQEKKPLKVRPTFPLYRSSPVILQGNQYNPNDLAQQMRRQLATSGQQRGVITLPQDGMPCILTAEPVGAQMPNAWNKGLRIDGIPNPIKKEMEKSESLQ